MQNPHREVSNEWPMDLPNRLHFMLKRGEWPDCSFALGTEPDVKVFNAHKILLSVASPVFRAMLYGGLVEKSPIKIVDVRPEIFQFLLDFIYTDQVMLETFEQSSDVWYAADKYMIPNLIEQCERRILQVLKSNNACQAYEIAKCFDRLDLMQRSLQIIQDETFQIVNSPFFEKVQLSTLLMILDSDKLNVGGFFGFPHKSLTDSTLLTAVMRWGTAECKRKKMPVNITEIRKLIDPALRKIRFLTFSAGEFDLMVQPLKILTKDEQALILKNILNKTNFPIMPAGFSTLRVNRNGK